MSVNNPIQNTKNYIAGIHKFITVGTGSTSVTIPNIVSQSDVEVMTIQNGNVGIGTTNPTKALHVQGNILSSGSIDAGTQFLGQATDSAAAPSFSWTGDTDTGMYRQAGNTFAFVTNGIDRVRIANGSIRLYENLQMYNGVTEGGVISTDGSILYIEATTTLRSLTIYNNTSASGANIFINANGTIFRSTSSLRYKKDIVTLEDSIADRILNCRSIKYKSIYARETPDDWTHYGFIAEEVALIEPRLVTYDQNNEPDGVQYDRFVPLLLNIIQRQETRIQQQETQIQTLESTIQQQETQIQTIESTIQQQETQIQTLESTIQQQQQYLQQLQSDYNNLIQTLQNKNIIP